MNDRNPVARQLHLLLTAYGYNLYTNVNRARADDILERERAGESLAGAASLLSKLATEYAARRIPRSTREQPFPPAEAMARLEEIIRLKDATSKLGSSLRGMSVPTQDRTWAKFRDEADLLDSLLNADYELITTAEDLRGYVEPLTADVWEDDQAAEVRSRLGAVERIARDRERLLQMPV
jgi:hypothetical protein